MVLETADKDYLLNKVFSDLKLTQLHFNRKKDTAPSKRKVTKISINCF